MKARFIFTELNKNEFMRFFKKSCRLMNRKMWIVPFFAIVLSLCFVAGCDLFFPEGYGTVKGYVLFEDLQPATNVEVRLGDTVYSGVGHPGNWITERKTDTDNTGYFVMKSIEDRPWTIKLAPDDPILVDYDVVPMYFSINVKKNKTTEVEFILIQKEKT
jgi:hypothetical protein